MQAVGEPLDLDSTPNAEQARELRKQRLLRRDLRNRSDGRRWLRDTAQAVAGLAGLAAGRAEALGLAMDGAIEAGRTLALLRGAGLRWYQDGLGRHFADGADALVQLSVSEALDDHDFVDRVLCRAFLADLRGEYASGAGWVFVRRRSAMVLLDNVGTTPARRFVGMLAAQPEGSGPLLVVAAGHQRFPDPAAKSPAQWQPDDLTTASWASWSRQRSGREGSRFYPVWTDPVDEVPATGEPRNAEVEAIAQERDLRPTQYPAVTFVRRLTAAHPAGMDMVLRTLDGVGGVPGRRFDADQYDLRGVFVAAHRAPRHRDPTQFEPSQLDGELLDDAVFELVLGPWTDDMRRALALLGIAVDLSDESLSKILDTEGHQIGRLVTEFRERDLWVTHQVRDSRPERPRLHPFARRAVAHRLGRDDGIAEMTWETAHTMLRDDAAERGDMRSMLHHDLALGRIAAVAAKLSELFAAEAPRKWYDLLLDVARAPLAHPGRGRDAKHHHGELCAGLPADGVVTGQLVAALQLHTDPLGDPAHEMCFVVTDELGDLAHHAGTGRAFLLEKSQDFKDCWDHWHRR